MLKWNGNGDVADVQKKNEVLPYKQYESASARFVCLDACVCVYIHSNRMWNQAAPGTSSLNSYNLPLYLPVRNIIESSDTTGQGVTLLLQYS